MSALHSLDSRRSGPFAGLHWLHWLVLGLSASVTMAGYAFTKRQIEDKVRIRFEREADHVVQLVEERMQKYEDALWAGVSSIAAFGGDVTYEEWRVFAEAMRIERKYPGINGIGVIHYVVPDELSGYLAEQRRLRPSFRIHPPHDQPVYWPISYIEPVANNQPAVGLDIAHERNRRTAAQRARDTGLSQVTAPIVLVQDAQKTPGFLFFAPFTRPGADGRFGGLVYAPFVVSRLMEGTLLRESRHVAVAIRDGEHVLYDEHSVRDVRHDPDPLYVKQVNVPLYGRSWYFDLRSDKVFRDMASSGQPLTILLGGATLDLLLLLLFVGLGRSHQRAVQYAEQVTTEIRSQTKVLEDQNRTLQDKSQELDLARRDAERARDAAQVAAEAKSTFLATMSHELRTPMNGVIGTAELLRDATDEEERRELNDIIISSGRTLLALINDVLDFSKLEAGKVALEPLPTAAGQVLSEVVSLLQAQADEKGIALVADVSADVPPRVLVDPLRLRQVLLNFASNAVKFTEQGRVSLSCRRRVVEDGTQYLLFEVIDTGIGIADTSMLFAEFTQADASTTRKFGGTGLGLAICKRLIGAMDGVFGVESTPDVGSRFWFELPLVASFLDEPSLVFQRNSLEPLLPASKSDSGSLCRCVLVADDNRVNRMVAKKLLSRMGFEVELAADGKEAVAAACERRYALIFMDCQMPVMDGYTATREIRRANPDAPPIVALTANAQAEDRERCRAAGMADHLSKPVSADELRSVLERWCRLEVKHESPPAARRGGAGSW